ncbi:unnamed protein product [Dracunculus medinensis]|uniref:Mitochondrial import receptor subunit TOM22 homolog n=1 Tax=Dracunculus medinensis TaxID=318479 RepID=A0A0N4UPE3_DRAME|nr:unnamed protein product [Dracunculus medinensis]
MSEGDIWDSIPDDELEETIMERLWGLREMFPESFRSRVDYSVRLGIWATQMGFVLFSLLRSIVWIGATTGLVMCVPYMIEKERAEMEKTQIEQQKKLLLGPTSSSLKSKQS